MVCGRALGKKINSITGWRIIALADHAFSATALPYDESVDERRKGGE
jgi:hypothetical protein